ncbi:hypothetical protein [Chamaesiphon minutus]|uniref:Uncharacterized protein n=1 Tax=Chamaesiphon minutus (strain ATCC 27169 / PCC 6605) TaxID=1173020 RepID=K9UIG5_CHAP6|nr:hypothetical protein [Chamaesiphon minutus]AFY94443.1 hypothetical protein Cha6605_3451 [Chamaesiphon minutus PCC 6605]
MTTRRIERLGGVFIAVMGTLLTVWNWHLALSEGRFYPIVAILGPVLAIIGIGLIIFPGYRTERLARGEDLDRSSGTALITARWWGVLAIAVGSGLINLAALKGWK